MAFGDVVQTHKVSLASGEAALTFPSTGTLGNLLTVCEPRSAQHSAGGAWGAPANWNKLHDAGINVVGAGLTGAAYWKISDGTETGFGPTTHTNEQGNLQPVFVEFEGPFEASPLDVQAEDANNLANVVTSQSTGTGGTTAQADELWVAFFCADAFQNIDGSRAYTNSFVERVIGDVSAARATGIIASKVVSSTGAPECTFSCTDTGDEMYGQIATFKKASGGGGDTALTVADAAHGHSAEATALVQAHVLTVADAGHAQGAENVALTQAHLLAASDAAHAHGAEAPALLQAHTLAVQDSAHAHGADNADLSLSTLLEVADAAHGHSAESVALVQAYTLAVADVAHTHEAGNVALVQAYVLALADVLHAHTVESVTVSAAGAVVFYPSGTRTRRRAGGRTALLSDPPGRQRARARQDIQAEG